MNDAHKAALKMIEAGAPISIAMREHKVGIEALWAAAPKTLTRSLAARAYRTKRPYSPFRREAFRVLRDAGWSMEKIGAAFAVSRQFVSGELRKRDREESPPSGARCRP